MVRTAIIFFLIGLVSYAVGITRIAGVSINIGVMLLEFCLVLSILSYIASLFPKNIKQVK